jgi:hypothetical protein
MRIKNNITVTLKKNLFDFPHPTRFGKEFRDLYPFIFPNKEIFISFLEEENFEQQTYYAEKILLRLSYDSFFPPPTKLLFNTLSMESSLFGEKKQGYIGRDHFVHLVHLYLLGIYSFFYYQILNENIFSYFRNIRGIADIKSGHISHSVIKDIIVSWRYFILFHDISYPIEYFLGTQLTKKDEYLAPFNGIQKSIGKDLSLRALSKFIGVSKLIKNKNENNFESQIKNHLTSVDLIQFNDFNLLKLQQLEKVYGFETIRTVYTVFGKDKIVPVLFDKFSMLPLLVYKYSNDKEYKTFQTINLKSNIILSKIKNEVDSPYNKDFMNLSNYFWVYFVDTGITVENIVTKFFNDINFDAFDKTVEYIQSLTSYQYSMVVSDSSFKQYCFDIYLVLYKMAGYFQTEDITYDLNYAKFLSEIVTDYSKDIPVRISDTLKTILTEKLEDIDFEKDMEKPLSFNEIIYNYLKKVSNTYKGFAEAIANPLLQSMQVQYESKKYIKDIRESLKNRFIEKAINNNLKIDTTDDKLLYDEIIADTNLNLKEITKSLNKKIGLNKLGKLEDVLKYQPKRKNQRKCFDHGVSSSLVFLSTIDIYKQLQNINDPNFKSILKIAFGIDFEKDKSYVKHKLDNIFSEVAYSILIHNIYPEFLSKEYKSYKTKLENSPFAYFCILMDSLQQWDRKFQVNQAFNELPYNTVSKSFNIEIKNNKIRITDFSSRIDIRKSLVNLKLGIDDYLYKASELIELNLGEY